MLHEKSCGAIVFRKNQEVKYLLLQYDGGRWGFVKGQVERNESEKDTAARELREETGISDAQFIKDFREKISYFYRRGGKPIRKEVTYFLIQTQQDAVKLSFEHVGYKWVNYQEAITKLTFKNARNLLKKAREFLEKRRSIEFKQVHKPT